MFVNVCLFVRAYFPCVYFHTEGGVWGNLLASDPADISGPCSARRFAPFCVFLETWLPCVALPDPRDNSQCISVSVKCVSARVFARVSVCVCSPSVQLFLQFVPHSTLNTKHLCPKCLFKSFMHFFSFSALQSWDVWLFGLQIYCDR